MESLNGEKQATGVGEEETWGGEAEGDREREDDGKSLGLKGKEGSSMQTK